PLAIEAISPIAEAVINPLADSGGMAPGEATLGGTQGPTIGQGSIPAIEGTTFDTSQDARVPDLAALSPQALSPTTLGPDTGAEMGASVDPTLVAQPAAVSEAAPARPLLSAPSAQDVAIGALIRRIRSAPHETCTLALPRRAGDAAGGGLSLIGAEEEALEALADIVVGEDLEPPPIQTREFVDPRQCAALDALRATSDYPVSRIGLALDTTVLASGDTLRARALGVGGQFLALLVVDDNGVVQDLAPFAGLDGDAPVIEVPVARSGPPRATRQMLLALGTTESPLDLSRTIGERAQDVFASIPQEQLEGMFFAVATFDVR
ncbi:MAG: hypothetical protein ACU0CI_13185, partial [Shimia sp.]